ncbi:Alpha/Beta hydrolase protein [Aspergillus carlsbadensis]|nr:Alpha/Beta hydrolase protein [Aspergillus carlsbadensis]
MLEYADPNAVPNDWRTRQPGCAIWCIIAIPRVILLTISYGLLYIFSPLRPNSQWTYTQALRTQLIKTVFIIFREIGFTQSLTLEAGDAGDKWVTINPAAASAYRGPFASNPNVKPAVIGGTWYPDVPPSPKQQPDGWNNDDDNNVVVLSFHSGSFLWLTGRPEDSGEVAEMTNKALGPGTRSFWPQYRLVGDTKTPTDYPAPMQDALTAYLYLVQTLGISPRRIVLAGDSSGATLALALVRYLGQFNTLAPPPNADVESGFDLATLPPPRACLMFSPSLEYCLEGDQAAILRNRNCKTDYVDAPLMAWGATAIAPPEMVQLDNPYLSPALHPFATPVPLFLQAGGAEVLCDSVRGVVERYRAIPGNVVEHLEVPDTPHDVYAVGVLLGWKEEQEETIRAAARFVRRHFRST